MSTSPFAARSRTISNCSSGVNSSPTSRSSFGSSFTFTFLEPGKLTSNVLDEGTTTASSWLTGDFCLPETSSVLRLLEVLFLRSPLMTALLRRLSLPANGELPLWNGFSSLKALERIGGLVSGSAGLSTLTVGIISLLRDLRADGRCTSGSGSVSVSDCLACLLDLFLLLEALPSDVEASGVVSSVVLRVLFRGFRFVVLGAGGGGIDSDSSSSSPLTVPS